MTTYRTEDIRNIALLGHGGSGKTSLVEKLLFQAGVITKLGSVEKGNTVSDFEPEEQSHHHSISTSVVSLDYNGAHINLLDTPGYPDFIGQTLSAAPAADTIAVVINAQNGIEAMARRLMDWASVHNYCRLIIVNKIDGEEHKLPQLVDDIHAIFGAECIPVNLPSKDGNGVVDCFFNVNGETAFSSVADVHTKLIEQVVEMDDSYTEQYLERGDVPAEQLHDVFEKALREGHLIPVCFVSARSGAGIDELLQVFQRLMPNPLEGTAHKFLKDSKRDAESSWFTPEPTTEKPALAHVFKVVFDPFIGRMGVFRIHQGKITKDTLLFVHEEKRPFKVGHLFNIQGKEHIETDAGLPGDICAVAKVDDIHFDAILHEASDEDFLHAPSLDLPSPMSGLALDAKTRGDEQKLAEALEKIATEDPCITVERNLSTHETVIKGLGELHLRVALEKIKERFHVDAEAHVPKIDYRETITTSAEGHFRHKKQSGGAGQFGEVFLRIEPLERGQGFEFVNAVVGGAIPGQFIPAVEKGVRQVMERGALAGYAIQDVKVTVYDGKHHSVDSNEISFVTAGRKAFLEAFSKAKPIILEPIVNIVVTAPQNNMGDISGDLASRRGRIVDTQSINPGTIEISAQVPMAELSEYTSQLKSMTGGEGEFTMKPYAYEPVSPDTQQQIIKESKV
jgi:elongation factor G